MSLIVTVIVRHLNPVTTEFDFTDDEPVTMNRVFLGWERPWLHLLVDYLLLDHQQGMTKDMFPKKSADFSDTVIILPGSRAGRRLLELLALKASEKSLPLIPPRIVTLKEAVSLLLELDEKIPPCAGALTCLLAWREAAKQLSPTTLANIQPFPRSLSATEKEAATYRIASLAEKIANELGAENLDFSNVTSRIGQLHPDFADREEGRWDALAQLQQKYRSLLSLWNLMDPTDALRQQILHGTKKTSIRVITCALVDYASLFESFLKKVEPTTLIAAPEIHAKGFDEQGKLLPSYWHQYPISLEDHHIIPCERSNDQAEKIAQKIISLQQHTNDTLSHLIAIAAPDNEALPVLREKLAASHIKTRSAGGRPFLGGRLFQLLQATAHFIDRSLHPAPSIKAVATLLRHPDISIHIPDAEETIEQLDRFERDHLPHFFEKERLLLFKKYKTLDTLVPLLENLIGILPTCNSLVESIEQQRAFLSRTIGKKVVRINDPEEHYFLGCLEKWLELLEEIAQIGNAHLMSLHGADLMNLMLEFLHDEEIPEQEESHAIELLGWLELAADDTPIAMISSFHEGTLPRSQGEDPLLNEGLRKGLGLTNKSDLLARDHYLLHSILHTRKASGETVIFAPRYNGRNEPVRPSRLLLLGCSTKKLPDRILALSQRKQHILEEKKSFSLDAHISSFQARPIGNEVIQRLPVTALRTYLQSPRLFYLKHVLKLQEVNEPPIEMNAMQFGTLIHSVLAAFGREKKINTSIDTKKSNLWLKKKLEEITWLHFGDHPQFSVWSQIDEIARSLAGFSTMQSAHCEAGWRIITVENSERLEEKIVLSDGRFLLIHGRIDRIDWHEEKKRWCIIDYKTSSRRDWESCTPNKEHYQKKGSSFVWHDLQLPLYLKLAHHLDAVKMSGLPLPRINNTDLCYFQLPLDPERASISEPFNHEMIKPAWEETERVIEKILDHQFEEIGNIDLEQSPTFLALCGITNI